MVQYRGGAGIYQGGRRARASGFGTLAQRGSGRGTASGGVRAQAALQISRCVCRRGFVAQEQRNGFFCYLRWLSGNKLPRGGGCGEFFGENQSRNASGDAGKG